MPKIINTFSELANPQIDNWSPADQLKTFIAIMAASNGPPPQSPPVTDGAELPDGLGQMSAALGDSGATTCPA